MAENLMLIIDSVSDSSCAAPRLWLKNCLDDGTDQKTDHERLTARRSRPTENETISMQAHSSMVGIVLLIADPERESESVTSIQAFNKVLYEALEMQLACISEIKNEALVTQDILHSIYTAYELGVTVMKFISYLSRAKQNFYDTKVEDSVKIREIAERIIKVVMEKSTAIKKGLDESGWIDKVLESLVRGGGMNEQNAVGDTLKGMIGENFFEEWAGHVLESWRDSVVGFASFKSPKA